MGTGAALVGESDDTTMGLVIEKVNGWALAKRVSKDEDFVDIHYLLEAVKQVCVAGGRSCYRYNYNI